MLKKEIQEIEMDNSLLVTKTHIKTIHHLIILIKKKILFFLFLPFHFCVWLNNLDLSL